MIKIKEEHSMVVLYALQILAKNYRSAGDEYDKEWKEVIDLIYDIKHQVGNKPF